jgi:hypothetical protein
MKPKNIELNIEEMVLHGFAAGDRYSIGEAVEQELTRLFMEKGTPHSLVQNKEIANVDGGAFDVPTGSKLGTIGMQVARAVYGGLRNERCNANTGKVK